VPVGIRTPHIRSLSSKIVKNAQRKIHKGARHGMCTTRKDDINADLLALVGVRSSNPEVAAYDSN
jgi:hypothetical protein